ncbi:hypothetical protein T4E_12256 [Trichinella pseudospiralis]|uniref:Uncharacterized protein n=1 Tax=Trichinella pseudospiralis TaxID=6337 RepID=A0A0V0XRL6_TRIPS|nr:hypothetical protein T4E_12256 [Trichinella pseudospiralis]
MYTKMKTVQEHLLNTSKALKPTENAKINASVFIIARQFLQMEFVLPTEARYADEIQPIVHHSNVPHVSRLWELFDRIDASIFETAAQSLFYVAYGEEKRIGLESYDLPKSLVDPAKTEEEIENSLASLICAERVPDVDRAAEDLKIFLVAIIAECKGLCTVGCGEG